MQTNNIAIQPIKAFIRYPSVKLLGQKIDSLGLATTKEKLKAISSLHFPKMLRQLETYLELTSWLHEYVEKYAKIAEPLTSKKTALLQGASIVGSTQCSCTSKTHFSDATSAEIKSFCILQAALSTP